MWYRFPMLRQKITPETSPAVTGQSVVNILIPVTAWFNHLLFIPSEIEWRRKAVEEGRLGEDDEYEDLTEDAKQLQEQELNKVREARCAAGTLCAPSITVQSVTSGSRDGRRL